MHTDATPSARCIDFTGAERPAGHVRLPQYPGRCARCGTSLPR